MENSRLACGTFREAARRVANNTMDLEEFTAEVWNASGLAQDATSDGSGGLPVPGSEWLPLFDAFVDMNVALRNHDAEAMKAAFQHLSPMCEWRHDLLLRRARRLPPRSTATRLRFPG